MTDEQQVRDLITAQNINIKSKDMEKIISVYADDASLFDLSPPKSIEGRDAIRKLWSESLPMMPDGFEFEMKDFKVKVMGEAAFAHWTQNFICKDDHPANGMLMRVTIICQKIDGRWLSVHEHVSTPMQP